MGLNQAVLLFGRDRTLLHWLIRCRASDKGRLFSLAYLRTESRSSRVDIPIYTCLASDFLTFALSLLPLAMPRLTHPHGVGSCDESPTTTGGRYPTAYLVHRPKTCAPPGTVLYLVCQGKLPFWHLNRTSNPPYTIFPTVGRPDIFQAPPRVLEEAQKPLLPFASRQTAPKARDGT